MAKIIWDKIAKLDLDKYVVAVCTDPVCKKLITFWS